MAASGTYAMPNADAIRQRLIACETDAIFAKQCGATIGCETCAWRKRGLPPPATHFVEDRDGWVWFECIECVRSAVGLIPRQDDHVPQRSFPIGVLVEQGLDRLALEEAMHGGFVEHCDKGMRDAVTYFGAD